MEDQNKDLLNLNEEQSQGQSNQPEQPKKTEKGKQKQATSEPVDEAEYNEYTSLKFLALSETKLKDETKKRLEELEAKLKSCEGQRPVRTVRAAIKNEQVLLVAGVPIPASVHAIITNSGTEKYYLGE